MNLTKKEFLTDLNKRTDWTNTLIYFSASYLISNRVSPYFSYYFIQKKVKPNTITLFMIISGVFGGLLFMLPSLWWKVLGALLIQLWFIFDCSDGEVARYTKTFSKYGSELDYLAHLIDHPFFCIAFGLSLIQLDQYSPIFITLVAASCLVLDSYTRNLITLEKFTDEPAEANQVASIQETMTPKNWLKMVFNTFLFFPNVILFGVIVYFIDYFFHTPLLLLLLLGNIIASLLIVLLKLKRKLLQYYYS